MTMRSNKAIVNAAGQTITTAGLAAGGALNPEQAKKFICMAEKNASAAQTAQKFPIERLAKACRTLFHHGRR